MEISNLFSSFLPFQPFPFPFCQFSQSFPLQFQTPAHSFNFSSTHPFPRTYIPHLESFFVHPPYSPLIFHSLPRASPSKTPFSEIRIFFVIVFSPWCKAEYAMICYVLKELLISFSPFHFIFFSLLKNTSLIFFFSGNSLFNFGF